MTVELGPSTATAYLQRRGVVPDDASPTARELGGGVSNHVVQVSWGGECVVAKQPLPNLAVEDDWPADVGRVHNEAAAARAYAGVVEDAGLSGTRVPRVVFEDRDDHVIAIECAPEGAKTWKAALLDGEVDDRVAEAVGRVLGAVHSSVAGDDEVRASFESKRPFDQLRIDPYHRTTAERHPDVADYVRAEIDRVLSVDRTLVHGDYSPKNVLVARGDSEDGTGSGDATDPEVWVLDFEVAHWGDPAFDTAFMCNHLFVKSIYNHRQHDAYVDAATAFWEAYDDRVDWTIERETVAELAVLMLARVDGKSPVEYISEGPVADALRRTAKRAMREEVRTIPGFAAVAGEEVERL
jgi:5-methylthioribose kinase